MKRAAGPRWLRHSHRYLACGALVCSSAFAGCSGRIDLGHSEFGGAAGASGPAAPQVTGGGPDGAGAPTGGGVCSGLNCLMPCGYTADYVNGGATNVLFCDFERNCTSPTPNCYGAGAPGGGTSNAGGSFGGAGGSLSGAGGSASGAGGSLSGAGGSASGAGGAATCFGLSCGAICNLSKLPDGSTQTLLCDAGHFCTPVVPNCTAGAGGT